MNGLGIMVAEGATAVSSADWASVLSAMTGQISVSTVVAVLASTTGAAIGLVFMWWGVRKLARVLMSAFRRGKLSV
jgi:hypothetical protein